MSASLLVAALEVTLGDGLLLDEISFECEEGKIYGVFGPNGSGKTTLAMTLAGSPHYKVTEGTITLEDRPLLDMSVEKRAQAGVFLAFQNPVEIPGVGNSYFIRSAFNAIQKACFFFRVLGDERAALFNTAPVKLVNQRRALFNRQFFQYRSHFRPILRALRLVQITRFHRAFHL